MADGEARGAAAGRLVDLSHPVRTGMPVYPGDPPVHVEPALTVARDGVNVLRLHLGSQSGTHVDAPRHVRDDLADLDAVPLERFVGPAVLLDARHAGARAPIGPEVLEPLAGRLAPGAIALFVTGWARHWGEPEYFDHPWPTPQTARVLVDAGVRTVGIDAASVDESSADESSGSSGFPTHQVLASAGCVIAENLRGLEELLDAQARGLRIEVTLFPLRLTGADGAPVRAVATVAPTDRPDPP